MTALPWDKFFWSDYASDPALKLCSFAAQGLWMRMLCIAAEHDPAGYVAINGRGLEPEEIARCAGGGLTEISVLVSELERNGVFSRDRRGWIYSRRMVRAAKMRRQASEWGKKGGNPNLRKEKENSEGDKGSGKAGVGQGDKPQKPESRDHSEGKPSGPGQAEADPDFDPVKALFDEGIRILGKAGSSEKSARSLIGRWRKEQATILGSDSAADERVALALAAADAKHISAPLEWIPKYLASRAERQPQSSGQAFAEQVIAEHKAKAGAK